MNSKSSKAERQKRMSNLVKNRHKNEKELGLGIIINNCNVVVIFYIYLIYFTVIIIIFGQ